MGNKSRSHTLNQTNPLIHDLITFAINKINILNNLNHIKKTSLGFEWQNLPHVYEKDYTNGHIL